MNREKAVALTLMGVKVQCRNCAYWRPFGPEEVFGECKDAEGYTHLTSFDDECPDLMMRSEILEIHGLSR
jgi:hypothetical protein